MLANLLRYLAIVRTALPDALPARTTTCAMPSFGGAAKLIVALPVASVTAVPIGITPTWSETVSPATGRPALDTPTCAVTKPPGFTVACASDTPTTVVAAGAADAFTVT